jgi:hypothetical protein
LSNTNPIKAVDDPMLLENNWSWHGEHTENSLRLLISFMLTLLTFE